MADIRINSLPTTASASSSDDFLALDGATNGTRKLNAYSPTFGGNLTVSGKIIGGNSSDSGAISTLRSSGAATGLANVKASSALTVVDNTTANTDSAMVFGVNGSGAYIQGLYTTVASTITLQPYGGTTAFGGNLTVSGTGTSSFAGNLTLSTSGSRIATGTSDGTDNKYLSFSGGGAAANTRGSSVYVTGNEFTTGNAKGSLQLEAGYDATMSNTMDGSVLFSTGGTAVVGYFNRLGNLILGPAAADSGNGKLQLATHTTSAGGIGFGTDTSLYRTSAGVLGLSGAVNAAIELYGSAAGIKAITMFEAGTIAAQVSCVSGSFQLKTGSSPTTALTLDSSQNATFAKTISAGTTITANGANTDVAIGVTMTGANARAWQWRIDSATGNLRLFDGTASNYPITFLGNSAGVIIGSQYNSGLTANTQSYGSHVFQCANVDKLTVADTKITISPTTASTSTTTGALVVSGGVGVAGAVNVGGAIAIGNTVNTVSPTSPNRTITMVIGGTTYYIHAKTTND